MRAFAFMVDKCYWLISPTRAVITQEMRAYNRDAGYIYLLYDLPTYRIFRTH